MAYTKLQFKAGINREITPYAEGNGWVDCDKVRFRFGYPEKLNGWQKNSPNAFLGRASGLHEFVSLDGTSFTGVGTNLKYYIKQGTDYKDITPERSTGNSCTFTIVSGTSLITVTDIAHGAVVNDFVTFSSTSAGTGNITQAVMDQEYQIVEVIDGNSYKVQPRSVSTIESITISGGLSDANDLTPNASGTPTGNAAYQIGTGLNASVSGTGWGAGLWGGINNGAFQTTIAEDLDASETDVDVATGQGSNFATNDVVLVGSELMDVSSVATDTLTVTRGANGTTAATHTNGDTIILVFGNTDSANNYNGWGEGIAVGVNTATSDLRIWSHDNFGEDLIINERNGGIFYWDNSSGVGTRAVELSTFASGQTSVPQKASQILLSDRDRHVIAFGADGLNASPSGTQGNGTQDPMLIRFSDQENPVDWYPTDTNTAGDLRIDAGSRIIQAVETRQQILVYTDIAIYAMQFIGPPFTFGINLISSNITIAGPQSAVAVNDTVYWMGNSEFYTYTGAVQRLPCTVRDYVFNDPKYGLNFEQSDKIVAGGNASYYEVWWFYPSVQDDSGNPNTENNRYVVYNYQENIWYYGNLSRTAWLDRGISQYPLGASPDNYLFDHERGAHDDGSAMTSFITSGDLEVSDGNNFAYISRVIPDLNFREATETSSVNFILTSKNAPGQQTQTTQTDTVSKTSSTPVDQYTNQYQLRLRGRSFGLKIESTDANVLWRLGVPRVDLRMDGRR